MLSFKIKKRKKEPAKVTKPKDEEVEQPEIERVQGVLPSEMLVTIFSFLIADKPKREALKVLGVCRLVCSEWRSFASHRALPFYPFLVLQEGEFVLATHQELRVDETRIIGDAVGDDRHLMVATAEKDDKGATKLVQYDTRSIKGQRIENWKVAVKVEPLASSHDKTLLWWPSEMVLIACRPTSLEYIYRSGDPATGYGNTWVPPSGSTIVDAAIAGGNLYISCYHKADKKNFLVRIIRKFGEHSVIWYRKGSLCFNLVPLKDLLVLHCADSGVLIAVDGVKGRVLVNQSVQGGEDIRTVATPAYHDRVWFATQQKSGPGDYLFRTFNSKGKEDTKWKKKIELPGQIQHAIPWRGVIALACLLPDGVSSVVVFLNQTMQLLSQRVEFADMLIHHICAWPDDSLAVHFQGYDIPITFVDIKVD